jgi:hypothetical protein
VARALALEPELAAVALDHVAHGQRLLSVPVAMASISQAITVSVLMAWPCQTRSRCAACARRRLQAQLHGRTSNSSASRAAR